MKNNKITLAVMFVSLLMPLSVSANSLRISTGLPQSHIWSTSYMDVFVDQIEGSTNISFTSFYGGELVTAGRSLDALQGGLISVAAPLLAPYHGGSFPLTDVTQLPTYDTTSQMVTNAFQSLMDSEEEIKDGKSFYEYEVESKGIQAWAMGAIPAYSISTSKNRIISPADFSGLQLRAGSAIHTIAVEELGGTPVTMPGTGMYEGLSRGTIDGTLLSIADWPAYSLEALLKYTLTGIAFGQWESYLAISNDAWNSLDESEQEAWDKAARAVAKSNSDHWESQSEKVKNSAAEKYDAEFLNIDEQSEELQSYVAEAAVNIWKTWVEEQERNGHPAKKTAQLYAHLILEQGGRLPEGVEEYLGIKN